MAWPTLNEAKRATIADEVVLLLQRCRQLKSSGIAAAFIQRQPLRAGLRNATDFNLERIKRFQDNTHIVAYVSERSMAFDGPLNVPPMAILTGATS